MKHEETYLTVKEAMEKLKISRTTLHRWRKQKLIKSVKIGTTVRVKLSDVEKAMK